MAGTVDTFPPVSEAEWRTLVECALDGPAFQSLVSTTFEGLEIALLSPPRARGIVRFIGVALSRPPSVL